MKKIYLIHGWGGSSSGGWFDTLKEEFSKKGFKVEAFDMPNTDYPKIEEWIGFMNENIKEVDKETYFLGHSIGCQAILRYLEQLPKHVKVGGCVFVAGWFDLKEETYEDDEDREIAKPWIKTPINFEKVKEHTNNFLAIFSDDDPYVPLSNKKFFEEKLGAKTIIKSNEEHFNETKEISEILEFLK